VPVESVRLVPPEPPLSAGQLVLRPWRDDDADAVHRACDDPDIARWTTVPSPYTRAHAEAFMDVVTEAWALGNAACFAMVGADDEVLGSIDLRVPDGGVTGIIGYWVARWARGRGVATTALVLVSDWAHGVVGLETTMLEIYAGNDASVRVAEKAGYHRAGRVRTAAPGPAGDALLYSRLTPPAG
jgi:RimJ/RimL family protein N-acetyltransferase